MVSMSENHATLEQTISGVLILQSCAGLVALAAVLLFDLAFHNATLNSLNLKSSAYGSLLAIVSTLLGARSMRRTTRASNDQLADDDKGHLFMVPVFSGLLNKLLIVGGGIALGLVLLSLEPILLVLSYLFVQIASALQLLR